MSALKGIIVSTFLLASALVSTASFAYEGYDSAYVRHSCRSEAYYDRVHDYCMDACHARFAEPWANNEQMAAFKNCYHSCQRAAERSGNCDPTPAQRGYRSSI
jgi:hypothetical protein